MNQNRLTHVHVYIIGLVLMLIIGGGLYYFTLRPIQEDIKRVNGNISSTESEPVSVNNRNFVYNQYDPAVQAVKDAKTTRDSMQRELNQVLSARRLPRQMEINLHNNNVPLILSQTLPRWVQLPRNVVTLMLAEVTRLSRKHNVAVQAEFSAPAPTLDPAAVPRDIIAWNLGNMSVSGSFNNVMRWARDWNSAPLLCAIDGLKCSLAGRNGRVSATCSLTVFIFPEGVPASGAGGGAGAGAAPAAGGGDTALIGSPITEGNGPTAGGNSPR